ncbi:MULTISPECIES: NADH-quinone oxidoreductase subunit L [Pseudomonas]|jgi:NADH-quinone oxidoreductase subunit L|uniref:NADH-quinone oxidoreductase subunit L n=1 Tax=Pseudomonas putida TaxID=303 RepID=A0A379KSY0_PSEPU|nr:MULTISPECIES: NADH-quinone oxidoreductase subunit L [Pseudomonas]QPN47226.1 NADH-quinone oxidoreductase subunit L [Priestia aryabhattai]KAF1306138.1 NADH-quinone oxidoreductase subunit L [Pseudomonas sp. SG-MS2]MBG6123711.1 NADH-quinone oxidoreductase subunit L [Pseudomonas sp. M2]NSX20208.1 NADH-quinone oxidoreductase subunit L [Pseudomonas putida]NWC80905.1 NADH-quinone oxidoreductase subunit L [Pseudomonas putida]
MNLLFLTFVFPLIGFLLLSFSRGRFSENLSALIGVGSVGLSAAVAAYVIWQFNVAPPEGGAYSQLLWQWMSVDGFAPNFTLYLDGLSVTMLGVVTGVGFLIHLFASWYMRGEAGYSRFFSYTNLFIASMLFLILGDNLLFIYFGWEGVGLCSYLLIGFYYSNRNNGNAALKAFIVTRIGDVFLAIGLFILFVQLGTLNVQELLVLAPQKFQAGDTWMVLATLMLLGGAVGKSAQLPLQTWLADAMAGPTPVSALIHAATMVTAGVYLIARTNGLFLLAPDILHLVGVVGGVTLVLAGFAALVQTDIKRILAYSTMSQIGYMFLALGVGAWDAAIFHLMTHAFFKALLFLASGAVIVACHHEQNIFKMGGLWKKLPLAYASFVVGGAALAALPILTVGFYSKDEILWEAFASGNTGLLYAGLVGAFMTSLYTFRLIFIAFHGEAKTQAHAGHGISHWLPLGVLIVLSTFVGAWIHPPLAGVLPESAGHAGGEAKHSLEIASGAIAIAGILLSALLFLGKRRFASAVANSSIGRVLSAWWFAAWGFDWIYDKLFVKPYLLISHILRKDPVDRSIGLIPRMARGGHVAMSKTETGQLRWYTASIAVGAVLVLGAVVVAAV